MPGDLKQVIGFMLEREFKTEKGWREED